MCLLGTARARIGNTAVTKTLILAQRMLGALLPRLVPFALLRRTATACVRCAALRAPLHAAATRQLAASIAGLPTGYAARPLASIPLFHGTAYLSAPLDAISNGMGSS